MTVGADLPPGGQTGEPVSVIPQDAPAFPDMPLPLPPFPGRTPSEAAGELSCWGTCGIDAVYVVFILTLCVSLWLATIMFVFERGKRLWAEFRTQTCQASDQGWR